MIPTFSNTVEPMIRANKAVRINWDTIYGVSLNHVIAEKRALGWPREGIYNFLVAVLRKKELASGEYLRRLKISFAARYGEQSVRGAL